MAYKNLEDMIRKSSRGRAYFYTLPTDVQRELQSVGDYIHTADELHAHARFAEKQRREVILSHKTETVPYNSAETGHTDL